MKTTTALVERFDRSLVPLPAGRITLRDEGTAVQWTCEVGPFLLGSHQVTRDLYAVVRGQAPSGEADGRTPMTDISWIDAVRFCNLASQVVGLTPCYSGIGGADAQEVVCDWTCDGYRLPSEAEWEYACRAGSTDVRPGPLEDTAWYRGNSGERVHDVGTRVPNAWGLHDMIGNVWEWCWDLYDPTVYGPYRVFRGGGAFDPPRACRASCRRKSHPTFHIDDLGLRLARSL